MIKRNTVPLFLLSLLAAGCTTINNSPAKSSSYDSPDRPSEMVQGTGIESQDIVAMTDKMARDMLGNAALTGRERPPRVIVDSQFFINEGTNRINKNMITDRLRVELNRAASGRMMFITREFATMVDTERAEKRDGTVDGGTLAPTRARAGADFRLTGRIATLNAVDRNSGANSQYNQITFEMVDLEYGAIVWSGIYEFKKSSQDDVIYR